MKITKIMSFALATILMVSCGGKKQTTSSDATGDEQEIVSEEIESVELPPQLPQGALSGLFSISASKQVRFSQGNLQYLPATKKWQFAKHQYDYVGLSNEDIADDYDGWIDLFGWGTSGWNNGGNAYLPTSKGESPVLFGDYYYGPKGNNYYQNDLTGDYANADWGVYNAISNGGNQANLWRTLKASEWEYLIFKRPNAMQLLALGTASGVNGLFIMPDDFERVEEFFDLATLADRDYTNSTLDYGGKCFMNKYGIWWKSFTKDEMQELQNLGVVFLPAAGNRLDKSIFSVNEVGRYWTATRGKKVWNYEENSSYFAGAIMLLEGGVALSYDHDRHYGYSVRLVQDVE